MTSNLTTTTTAVQIAQSESGVVLDLPAEFHYDPADPLSVSMVILSISGPVRWTFARELILHGRFEPTGKGDVHVWPCLDNQGAAVVIVELESLAGATLLQVPARAVHEFVSASLSAVPEGTEQLDVDSWLAHVFPTPDNATN